MEESLMTSFDQNDHPDTSMNRRTFLAISAGAAVSMAMAGLPGTAAASSSSHVLPTLPWGDTDLEPVITARTLSFHYGKHHQGYVNNLNRLIPGTAYADLTLEEIVNQSAGNPDQTAIFNNAAQVWNHTFYWHSLSPKGGGEPPAALTRKMKEDFGSVDACRQALLAAATTQFASGWAWLVLDNGTLKAVNTGNAKTPLTMGMTPLLTIDVWEHAYYLDYQNQRKAYVEAILDKRINWAFALENAKL